MIYADLHKTDDEGRLILTTTGTLHDLSENEVVLSEGLRLTFYSDDADDHNHPDNLVYEGIVQFDESHNRWVARIHWETVKNISQLSVEERQKLDLE